jgi:hypothetical protein
MVGPSFLTLPLELRLIIYDLTLEDSCQLTIATVPGTSTREGYKANIPGLPASHIPIVKNGCHPELLDFTRFAPQKWSLGGPCACPSCAASAATSTEPVVTKPVVPGTRFSPNSLLATCRQVRSELLDHVTCRPVRPLKLHVSYPYGILVLHHIFPALLRITAVLIVAGFCTGEHEPAVWQDHHAFQGLELLRTRRLPVVHDASVPSTIGPNPPNISLVTHEASMAALKAAIHALMTPLGALLPWVQSITVRTFTPVAVPDPTPIEQLNPGPATALVTKTVLIGRFCEWCWSGQGGTVWVARVTQNEGGTGGKSLDKKEPLWGIGQKKDWLGLVSSSNFIEPDESEAGLDVLVNFLLPPRTSEVESIRQSLLSIPRGALRHPI